MIVVGLPEVWIFFLRLREREQTVEFHETILRLEIYIFTPLCKSILQD